MKAIINNSCCQILCREKLPRKTVGKTMEVEFSADWKGLAITAVFEAGAIKKDVVYTGEPIIIPHEVLATEGLSVMIGFHGALPDGTIVKRTVPEWINNVSASLDPSGESSSEPTPDWTAQVQAIATEAKEVANSVRNDADEGKFNGGQGPQGPAGATGPKGDAGAAGEAGGYYTPAVTQPDENTLRVAFTPSKEDMPAVAETDITLPAGGGGGGSGEDGGYYAPSVDDEGNLTWTASKTDMPAVDGTNIKGPKGDTGATGAQGPAGATGPAGADGKSAYAYAVEGGYTGTEAEFAAKLAKEKFANPEALTFTGAITGSYDGSEALTVNIPSGGGGGTGVTPELLFSGTAENVSSFSQDVDFKGHNNLTIVVRGTKADSEVSIKEGSLHKNGQRYIFAYYTKILSATSESAPKGSVVFTIQEISADRCLVDFSEYINRDQPFWELLQPTSSTQSSAKRCHMLSTRSTTEEKIGLWLSAAVPSITVDIYGF